ncbi:MAG: ATP-grasp domain-containing protein [Elusimicrobia bacterium]|nr:ATP-grasp domain-containing protein [Elusimicrobiota bacterium]
MKKIRKVLVANRGEIAVRIMRTLHAMGIKTVAVYSEADRDAPHVELAGEARLIGPAPSRESYLKMDTLLSTAKASGADAIHPGFGFLAENPEFAQAVADAGLSFIGPSPSAIREMGNKLNSRALALKHKVPVIPAVDEREAGRDLLERVKALGFPVLIKAAAGGGGKGMRVVERAEDLKKSLEMSKRESINAFNDDHVFVEKYLRHPRHIEFQVLGDLHGRVVHLNERECSIQRRHQKIIEETPSPLMTEDLRAEMGEAAVRLAKAVSYTSAGTVEFMVDADKKFYLLEMNTRLQVEHPVTEMTLGMDLVYWQVRIAEGRALPFRPGPMRARGHSIECRIYAEDPAADFIPCAGRLAFLREPGGPWIRNDCGVRSGSEVTTHYDPMISKLVAWGETREASIARMKEALRDYIILGLRTNREYLLDILDLPAFREGKLHTGFLKEHLPDWQPKQTMLEPALIASALYRKGPRAQVGTSFTQGKTDYNPWLTVGNWGR